MVRQVTLGGILILGIVAAGPLVAQDRPQPVGPTAGPATEAAVKTANEAIQELQTTLVGRLSSAMADGGPRAAVRVCRDEARALTASVGAAHGVAIGRTSDRLRNPANAPRPWAAPIVAAQAGRKAAEATPVALDLGDRVGVLRPIGTLDFCVTCHGPAPTVDAAIGDVLKAAYPEDRAVGFAPGDLRGWFWVEVPKSRP